MRSPSVGLGTESGRGRPLEDDSCYSHVTGCDSDQIRIRSELLPYLWPLFKMRVDPVVKVLHIPSVEPVILAASDLKPVSKESEALIFAISYSPFP